MDVVNPDCSDLEGSITQQLVLIVDDNEDNLLLAQFVLESLNCSIVTETSGQAALTIARAKQPSLILLDVFMPDVDGFELIGLLKQDASTAQIPVIAVSAIARVEDHERLFQSGFVDFIGKPYDVDVLQTVVRHHLSLAAHRLR